MDARGCHTDVLLLCLFVENGREAEETVAR